MNHFSIYRKNRSRLRGISLFFLALVALSLLVSVSPANIIKLAAIAIIVYYLLEGKKWAVTALTVIAAWSMLQGIMWLIGMPESTVDIVLNLIFVAAFGYIIYYLNTSDSFYAYNQLKKSGFDPADKDKKFEELLDTSELIQVDPKAVNTPEAYFQLLQSMLYKVKVVPPLEISNHKGSQFEVETPNMVYQISYNDRINVLDRSLIDKTNKVLRSVGSHSHFYIVYPDSILNPSPETLHIALLKGPEHGALVRNGYAKA